jgi:hypothetical protein
MSTEEKEAMIETLILDHGHISWSEEEIKLAKCLKNDSDYCYRQGSHKGFPNYKKIAETVNV